MGEIPPIDVGAQIETHHIPRSRGRITNIYIDEDGTAHVTIDWKKYYNHRPEEKVSYDDIREMLEAGEITRTNTGHEAWKWRTENVSGV